MVALEFSAWLDEMVLSRWIFSRSSIVQNFQYAVKTLKYCAGSLAH
jgi:hypothetical protein